MKDRKNALAHWLLYGLLGVLIGVGAVLPGISGGALCVAFGIYKPVMELLGNPLRKFKTHVPKLLPVLAGAGLGFLGVANVLSFFLEAYPGPSKFLFIGLILSVGVATGSLGMPLGEAMNTARDAGLLKSFDFSRRKWEYIEQLPPDLLDEVRQKIKLVVS